MNKSSEENIGMKNFEHLFKQISSEEVHRNFFAIAGKLVGEDMIITAGKENHYNSMTGSVTGLAFLFKKPTAWCFFREDRYTLEMIQIEQAYTLSYFTNDYMNQILFLGSKSGRDSDKMKEIELTSVQTPTGEITFKEARLVIECKLTQITTADPNDFYSQEAKNFVTKAYNEEKFYRKMVLGEISHIWVNNQETTQ